MYPFLRLPWQFFLHRNEPDLPFTGVHESTHICWPWDLDFWMELNNGRTLTLYDLGRLPLSRRTGLLKVLKENQWGMTIAGSNPRYRRRILMFEKITMRSRALGWDAKFVYSEQSMWKSSGECANHALFRSAVISRNGIVPPAQVMAALGHDGPSPDLPDWVTSWIAADATRPWPPMQDVSATFT